MIQSELDKKVQEVIELKRTLTLDENLQYLFEEIDEVCQEMDKRSMEFYSQLDSMSNEQVLDYYSKYNLTKRLLRMLTQANTAVMEYLQPEFFKKCGERKQHAIIRCLKCNVTLLDKEEVSHRMCHGCINTAE
tara:strand:+ start:1145 stop:1543 length:399 start_codon:yes stop_codon:yes gene_type:complete